MADGLGYTPGAGATVATDDISSVHYQRNKIALGPNGTWTADLGGVDLGSGVGALFSRLRPGALYDQQTSSGLTTGATPYSADDVLGAGWTIANAANVSAGGGWLRGAALVDESDVTVSVDLYLASASITFGTDNAGASISDADALKLRPGQLGLTMRDLGGVRIGIWDRPVRYNCDATSLFIYAQTLIAHNQFGAATALKLFVDLEPD